MRGKAVKKSGSKQQGWLRRAGAVVEMAIVSPLLLGLLFGIVEYGWVFMLQSNLTSAAREACRVGILYGTTDADIQTRFAEAISGTGLTTASYTLQIARVTNAQNVTTVTITARVPWAKASLVGGGILPDPKRLVGLLKPGNYQAHTGDMVATCSMIKEG